MTKFRNLHGVGASRLDAGVIAATPTGGVSRRSFLRGAAAALAGTYTLVRSTESDATGGLPWGDYPDALKSLALPKAKQAKNVLELFVFGGLCPWETFYASDDPEYGFLTDYMWWTFQQGPNNLPQWTKKNPECKYPPVLDFMPDALGHMVKLGTLTEPLRSRADIVGRLRLQILSHGVYPHDFARALASTGYAGGSPRLSGLGTAVSHYQLDHAPSQVGGAAYVLAELPTLLPTASRVGSHPVAARPLELRVDGSPSSLFQTIKPQKPAVQSLGDALRKSYLAQQTWPGEAGHVRSKALSNLDSLELQLASLEQLGKVLKPSDFDSPAGMGLLYPFVHDLTQTKLQIAAKILTQTGGAARHVTVVETGYSTGDAGFGVGGYDFHQEYVQHAVDMYPRLWKRLCDVINAPGEQNPQKLNLDDTLVVINTEFGRAPLPQNFKMGRNHHPAAYVTAMFGGPVGTAQKGIVGAIDKEALPVNPLTPAETRMATLVALGIYPFSKETFDYTDVPGAKSPEAALVKLNQIVLGVPG